MKRSAIFILITIISLSAMAGNDLTKDKDSFQYKFSLLPLEEGFKNFNTPGRKKAREDEGRPDFPGDLLLDVGVSILNDRPGEMRQSIFRSRGVNIYYLYPIDLGDSKFSFHPGIGLGMDRYAFRDNNSLDTEIATQGNVVNLVNAQDLFENQVIIRRSFLQTTYLDVPLEFRYYTGRERKGFFVAVGGLIGLRLDSKTRVLYEEAEENKVTKQKESFNLNPLRYGVITRLGIGGFNLFGFYNFAPIFRPDKGPEGTQNTNYFKVGLSFAIF
jgi:hypothetical protein